MLAPKLVQVSAARVPKLGNVAIFQKKGLAYQSVQKGIRMKTPKGIFK